MSSSQGQEIVCPLQAGTYQTEFLRPQLTYTVPSAGWSSMNREASPGNFHLIPPGGSFAGMNDGSSDDITMLSAVVPPGRCNGLLSTDYARTYDGLMESLTANDRIALSNQHDVTVGGLDGIVMDVTYVASDGCPDGDYTDMFVGVSPSHGVFGIAPVMVGMRLYLLHYPGSDKALAVLIDDAAGGGSTYGDGDAWHEVAGGVIDTFVFTPAP